MVLLDKYSMIGLVVRNLKALQVRSVCSQVFNTDNSLLNNIDQLLCAILYRVPREILGIVSLKRKSFKRLGNQRSG